MKFAQEGATVVVAARRRQEPAGCAKDQGLGAKGLFIKTDVTKRANIEALVDGTVAKFGKLDCAVNNAGITGPVMVPLAEIEEEAWDELMNAI